MKNHKQILKYPECDNYMVSINGYVINTAYIILIGLSISMLPLLVNSPSMIVSGYSMPVYVGVIIILGVAMYCGLKSALLVSLISGGIYFVAAKSQTNSFLAFFIWNIANLLQILIMFLGITLIEKKRKYKPFQHGLTPYKTLLLVSFILYCYFTFTQIKNHEYCMIIISLILFSVSILKSRKDPCLFKYIFGVAVLPSVISSFLFSYLGMKMNIIQESIWIKNFFLWWLSNYILLQTVGYLLFLILYQKDCKFHANTMKLVHADSLMYYIAVFAFNIFIIHIYRGKILDGCEYVIVFPYLLGNFLLGTNFYFSHKKDCLSMSERFKWYEGRVITIEKNMSIVITIITFLIPMGLSRAQNVPPEILPILILNILFACMTVGLVWIPECNVKFMSLTKTIKTISFSYAIVLALINLTQIFKLLLQGKN